MRTLEGAVRSLQNACRDARDDAKELREENARLRVLLETHGQSSSSSHDYIPPPQSFAPPPSFQGSPHVSDLTAQPPVPQSYTTFSGGGGGASQDPQWPFDMNFDHTTPDFSPLSSGSGSLPQAPSPSYLPDLSGAGGQSGSYYAPSSRSLSPSPFGEAANPPPTHHSSLDSSFNHLSIFGSNSGNNEFPLHFPQGDAVEWNPAMLYAASPDPNTQQQQQQQQYEEQQRELDRHETVKANKARRPSETGDGNHESLDRNDTLKATARPSTGRDHRYRPYSAADAAGHQHVPFVGKLEEEPQLYGHFRSGSSASSSSSYNSLLDSSGNDALPTPLMRADSRRHSFPVASNNNNSAIEDSPSPSHVDPKESDDEALSYTLAVLKSQAFGTVRKSRVRTKRPSAANDAAKVAMHALNARALSLGLDIVPTDGGSGGSNPRRLRSQRGPNDMDNS